MRLNVVRGVWEIDLIPRPLLRLAVEQQPVLHDCESLTDVRVRRSALPCDFISILVNAKNSIHQHLQVVARRGVTVQVDRTSFLQYAPKFDETWCHHCEIRHHVTATEECMKRNHYFRHRPATFNDLLEAVG